MMTNHGNRITQGQFSFLPDLTDAQITAQIEYALKNNFAISVEYTDDPHPRNTYWEMFGMPMFDLKDAAGIMMEINNCRKTFSDYYIRVTAFNSVRGVESPAMSFIVNRPKNEPGFMLQRTEIRAGRSNTPREPMSLTSPKANATSSATVLLVPSPPAGEGSRPSGGWVRGIDGSRINMVEPVQKPDEPARPSIWRGI